ncbi:unnamed protein product [Boreogadus saida]
MRKTSPSRSLVRVTEAVFAFVIKTRPTPRILDITFIIIIQTADSPGNLGLTESLVSARGRGQRSEDTNPSPRPRLGEHGPGHAVVMSAAPLWLWFTSPRTGL